MKTLNNAYVLGFSHNIFFWSFWFSLNNCVLLVTFLVPIVNCHSIDGATLSSVNSTLVRIYCTALFDLCFTISLIFAIRKWTCLRHSCFALFLSIVNRSSRLSGRHFLCYTLLDSLPFPIVVKCLNFAAMVIACLSYNNCFTFVFFLVVLLCYNVFAKYGRIQIRTFRLSTRSGCKCWARRDYCLSNKWIHMG